MSTSWKIHKDFFSYGGKKWEKVEVLGNYVCSTALFHHYFLNVQQAAYLKEAKAILDNETCIILMDFLELVFLSKMQYKASFGRINKLHFIPLQCTTMMIMVNLNVTVIMSYQIIYCMIRLQFTVLFH